MNDKQIWIGPIERDHHHYLEWLNNYLTLELFAEHKDWSVKHAWNVIKRGRAIHCELND